MDGLPTFELNSGMREFAERMRMHPEQCATVDLTAIQYHGDESTTRYSGPLSDDRLFITLRTKLREEKLFVADSTACKAPDLSTILKKLNPSAKGGSKGNGSQTAGSEQKLLIVFMHNRLKQLVQPNLSDFSRVLFVAIDDPELVDCSSRLPEHPVPKLDKPHQTILLKGVMFVEFFQWLADQLIIQIGKDDNDKVGLDKLDTSGWCTSLETQHQ